MALRGHPCVCVFPLSFGLCLDAKVAFSVYIYRRERCNISYIKLPGTDSIGHCFVFLSFLFFSLMFYYYVNLRGDLYI